MKKVEKISELNIGQTIYVDEEGKKDPYVIRSLENKFVSFTVRFYVTFVIGIQREHNGLCCLRIRIFESQFQ